MAGEVRTIGGKIKGFSAVHRLFLGVCLDCGSETVPFCLCYVGLVLIPLQGSRVCRGFEFCCLGSIGFSLYPLFSWVVLQGCYAGFSFIWKKGIWVFSFPGKKRCGFFPFLVE